MFWLENLQELSRPDLIPNNYMTFEEKINSIIRMIIFIGIIATLVFNDTKYILFVFIIMLISIIIYNYHYEKILETEKYLNIHNLDIIDNKTCVKPSEDNPFMNPNITDIEPRDEDIQNCPIDNQKVKNNMKQYFYASVFRETDDIYDKNLLERQFYTIPSTGIPNDRDKLANWLYNRGPSCKENNGAKCYNNLYIDLRNSSHF